MTSLTVIENKISDCRKYIKILDEFKKYSRVEIEKDILIRGSLERYLYLATQAAINVAEAIVAHRNLRKPSTMSEAFDILQEEKLIDVALAERMVKMTGFRNVIAHDYAKINYEIVYEVLHAGLQDVEEFLAKAPLLK